MSHIQFSEIMAKGGPRGSPEPKWVQRLLPGLILSRKCSNEQVRAPEDEEAAALVWTPSRQFCSRFISVLGLGPVSRLGNLVLSLEKQGELSPWADGGSVGM